MKVLGLALATLLLTDCGSRPDLAPEPDANRGSTPVPTASESSAPAEPPRGDIPDDFPLAVGWPADSAAEPGARYGLRGPNRRLAPLEWVRCDRAFTPTGARDRLRADWSDVEDFRSRELLTFADSDAAVAFTTGLVGHWRACPREDTSDDYERVNRVQQTRVGGESWALVSWSEYDGNPAVGLEIAHVTRLGRAVLVDTASNEGGGGPDRDGDIDRQVEEQVRATDDVVAAMCRFTEAGCSD